ncbi:Hypothetical predicted protein [Pelobates cultripes]|uniref:Uncharacterized protein n=1 Tax=Pelobates cultripes TaxID=61616 RepID=A0AAD1RJW8_PELCU|nr:Hypothetical predicted protein [Pelobates cultripes]
MADTTCADNASDASPDILMRIQSHFDAFWRKLEGKLLQTASPRPPTPTKRTSLTYSYQANRHPHSRPAPTTTRAGCHCKPAFPFRRYTAQRSGMERPQAPKPHH